MKKLLYIMTASVLAAVLSCASAPQSIVGDCTNGSGKIVYDNGDVYAGSFLNGKYEGSGKMDYSNGATYSGEWFEGDPSGYGTMIYSNGEKYAGQFKNGRYEGLGIVYNADSSVKKRGIWKNGKLKFPGDCKGDCLNGYGTITYENGEKYEGQFVDGQYCGIGMLYDADGSIKQKGYWAGNEAVGDFTGDCRNGKGSIDCTSRQEITERDPVRRIPARTSTPDNIYKYTGNFKDGKYDGQGVLSFVRGDKYEGQFKDGKYYGEGALSNANGDVYTGQFKYGNYDGQGTLKYAGGGTYTGQFSNGLPDGKGTKTCSNGDTYDGQFSAGRFLNGQGTETANDGSRFSGHFKDGQYVQGAMNKTNGEKYSGQFKEGKYDGQGVMTSANGDKLTGLFENGLFKAGKGTETQPDGSRYIGQFKEGKHSGYGTLVSANKDKYSGQFLNGVYEGQGVLICCNGNKYEGKFVNGTFSDGQGVETQSDGSRYAGQFKDGKYSGKGTLTYSNGDFRSGQFDNGQYIEPKRLTFSASEIVFALRNDVFSYFSEDLKPYDTDLKKEVFKKTDQYKEYKDKLADISSQIWNNRVVISVEPSGLHHYDLKARGFYYPIGSDYVDYGYGDYPVSIKNFCFDRIPTVTVQGIAGTDWRVFLPCDESSAVKIEDNRDIVFEFEFNVTGIVEKKYTTYVMGTGYKMAYTGQYVNTKNIELRIVDKKSGEVIKRYYY